ncbi:MAG: prepilin-type N-terminal cleavage/methylation domain-containing protein [Planctomycetota bacterium]
MRREAFTLIELLVVLTIIGLLVGLLVPVLAAVRDTARGTQCMANQDQLMVAVYSYSVDNRGRIPFGPEEGQQYTPPLPGEDSGGRDFYVIDGMVTSEVSTVNGDLVGAGLLYEDYLFAVPEVFFCPGSDDNLNINNMLDRVGKDSVISGYLYRHGSNTFIDSIIFNQDRQNGRMDRRIKLDNLGKNSQGEPIAALFVDNNFQTAPGSTFNWLDRSNHGRVFSNIAFADGHVEQRNNADGRYVADIGGTTLLNALDRIMAMMERADMPD